MFSVRNDRYADEWKEYLGPSVIRQSVLPDISHVDLDKFNAKRNVIILEELVDRSERKVSLIEGMQNM